MAPETRSAAKRRRIETSAAALVSCFDMIFEILMLLPTEDILRCKAVCKGWNSLISKPLFVINHAKRRPLNCGLTVHLVPNWNLLSLEFYNNCGRKPKPLEIPVDSRIQSFCKGLVCYSIRDKDVSSYYVFNLTTRQSKRIRVLGHPKIDRLRDVILVFDPRRTAYYNLIFLSEVSRSESPQQMEIDVYSRNPELRRYSLNFVTDDAGFSFGNGLYWKGAIYWCHYQTNAVACFDFRTRRFERLELPELAWPYEMNIEHFGESRGGNGHLILVGTSTGRRNLFTIFQMKDDRSGWDLKCRSDFGTLANAFPQMVSSAETRPYLFSVLSVGEITGVDWLVIMLRVPGYVVLYSVRNKTLVKLSDLPNEFAFNGSSSINSVKFFKFVETIASV